MRLYEDFDWIAHAPQIIPWTRPSILVMQERYTSNSSKLGNGSPSVRFRADGHGWVSLAGLLNGATHLENGNETPDLGIGMKITLRFKVSRTDVMYHADADIPTMHARRL